MSKIRISLFAILAATALSNVASKAATVVYTNDFTSGAGSEWSDTSIKTTNGETYLADPLGYYGFGAGTDTLTLSGLAAHTTVTLSFDLYIIGTMDGNGPAGGGPDPWSLTATGGSTQTLIDTNFANYSLSDNTQSFGGPDGSGGYLTGGTYAVRTGETDSDHLGYGSSYNGDATYHLTFTFNDASSSLALAFISAQNQPATDEGWGLDNVTVSTNADQINVVPLPNAAAMGGAFLLLAASAAGIRKKMRA